VARPRTDIQPRIVQAARVRFLSEGVDGASLRTIAADAGTSVGMIFYYFPTKDDLFLAVVEEYYAKLLEDLSGSLLGEGPVRDRLRRAFVRLGRASEEELQVVRMVARESLLSSERFHRVLSRAQRGHLAMMLAAIADGVKGGEIDPTLPAPVVLLCTLAMGGLPQLVRRATDGGGPFPGLPAAEALADLSVELLFRAISPPLAAAGSAPARATAARSSRRRSRA
jgi:AcrR family transcriptional regulator